MKTRDFLGYAYNLASPVKKFLGKDMVRLLKFGIRLNVQVDGKPIIRIHPCYFPDIKPDALYPFRNASKILEAIYEELKRREQHA